MIRTFQTHKVRETVELSSCLWNFHTMTPKGNGKTYQVPVPSCWETYPGMASYRGMASYSREFEAQGNVRLVFEGVSHTAEVMVDGKLAAAHYNAYTSFGVVQKNMLPGKHHLEVLVDNSFGENSALHVPNDYQSYGGISRGVTLEFLKDVYISCVHITPVLEDGKWTAALDAELVNFSETPFSGRLEVKLEDALWAEIEVSLKGNETRHFLIDGKACGNVKEWSLEEPNLYLFTVLLENQDGTVLDDQIERTGFREVRIEGKEILLNGKKVRIKGFCRHEDHPQFGCALPFSAIHYDLMLARDLGANSIRTSHYPNDEIFLDLCDELGILVWEENHARGLSEDRMRNPNFERQCEDCIREMIRAHYNHPSIYIWGILNECASDTKYGRECYEKQYALIRELDQSRPRSSASCRFKTDICLGYPEVVSYNIYPRWYLNTPAGEYLDDIYQWVQTDSEGSGKPFLVTEIGAGAIYGYRTPDCVKWSEEYQRTALEE